MMRIVFMGTPDFAVASLKALAEQGTDEIVGVFTQPDRPKGRGQKMLMTPVKEYALEKGYEVHGIIRRASVSTTARIDHIMDKITIHEGDLSDSSSIIRIVLQVKPDEIYNLAAQSHVQVSFDAAEYTGDVDALGVLRILEAVHIAGLEKTFVL